MDRISDDELIEIAKKAREKAYTPYSDFPIGAALLTSEGEVYTGVNIENASYSLTNCAERTALFKAISEGHNNFEAIAVVADSERPIPPCGACRQVIYEFGEDIRVIMSNLKGDRLELNSSDLLPGAFNREDIN